MIKNGPNKKVGATEGSAYGGASPSVYSAGSGLILS